MRNLVVLYLVGISLLLAEQRSSLVMVRCDKGNGYELLSSPSQIDMSGLWNSFNPNVDTIVLVHGFNTSFKGASQSFGASVGYLQSSLGDRNYVGFYWPSDTMLSFGDAVKNANNTGAYLIHVLSEITRWYGSKSKKIHIMSHSLGGRVLLGTLKENDARYVKWGYCFSFAAAVHSNIYTTNFVGTNLPPLKTHVYYSKNDWVLKYLYALYYWLFDASPFERTAEYEMWQKMSVDEKIEYMHRLDLDAQQGNLPTAEFDKALYQAIQRAAEDAMGLIGANPLVSKVENVEVSGIVSGHSYWDNREIMQKVSDVLK